MPTTTYLGRVVLFVAVVCLAVAAWQVKHVVPLLFGGFFFAWTRCRSG